ncbi:MAG: DUF924 domain-containing protein [Timaviella obliquedivisa GSE-PSE-MK23-08B]|jgi:uncharacterized protein (DUF924 family)|nr:DUF924 domain-containing protein [Timaviella obliquedivisa GSE-PSE-MK23-08B]
MATLEEVLQFWFSDPQSEEAQYSRRRKVWFSKNPEIDQTIHRRFLMTYEQAASGELDGWQATPAGCLALILLLDQFPRNLFRGQPQAFATDPQARILALRAIAQGFDQSLAPIQRIFIYLPLEHGETLSDQHQSVTLFQQLTDQNPELADVLDYAVRHQIVIERFGRFPHRNAILGRTSTAAELEFLNQPGSSF